MKPDYPLSTFVNPYLGVLSFVVCVAMHFRDVATITAAPVHDYKGDLVGD